MSHQQLGKEEHYSGKEERWKKISKKVIHKEEKKKEEEGGESKDSLSDLKMRGEEKRKGNALKKKTLTLKEQMCSWLINGGNTPE